MSLLVGIRKFISLCSADAMGLYVTLVVSTIDVCIGLRAKISNLEFRDTDLDSGDTQTNVT